MNDEIATILDFVDQTADSLGESFSNYWPADDEYDPAERNVSLHFAHAMLSAGFSVFAEANHEYRSDVQAIDLLGLAPHNAWFVGCEFKCLYNTERLQSFAHDIDRLESFWLRTDYDPSIFGKSISEVTELCTYGYGLVSGLHWVFGGKESSSILDIWAKPDIFRATELTQTSCRA